MSEFFDEAKEQSQVKTAIVAKYFTAWARVIVPWAKKGAGRIAYIDLFAGPGRYKDGTKSTPILVLEKAVADPDLRQMLVSMFNDADADNTQSLQAAIDDIPGIMTLAHKPQIANKAVGTEIVATFEAMHLVPTLFFVDPWGYKGLSLRLVNSVLKDWGCDCILFFNFNRINMGITNPLVDPHIDALFGTERAHALRARVGALSVGEREAAVVEAICDALVALGGRFVLPFRFKHPKHGRTSHHLIFVSKNVRGYEIMKDIMAGESSAETQGVPSFEYNVASRNQGLLFDLTRPLDDLSGMLVEKFAGRRMSMLDVYNEHHVGRPYVKRNYKAILQRLEQEGAITATPPAAERRKGTFADVVVVQFPAK